MVPRGVSAASAEVAPALLDLALSRPPMLGDGRLVCIDGPAGSGKTTLATAVAVRAADSGIGSRVVHMDDLYDGWDGLLRVGAQLDTLLAPLAVGRPGHYRRYDWHASAYAETVTVPPCDLLVLEGVGSGSARHSGLVTVLAWLEAPAALRLRRGVERDGVALRDRLVAWQVAESELFAREGTRARADLVVDTASGA